MVIKVLGKLVNGQDVFVLELTGSEKFESFNHAVPECQITNEVNKEGR